MLHNFSLGFVNITNGYHGNQEKGITMVTAAKIKILKILKNSNYKKHYSEYSVKILKDIQLLVSFDILLQLKKCSFWRKKAI